MIWIIGGTSETVELVKALEGKADFVVSAATESEKDFVQEARVVVGRMDKTAMLKFIAEGNIKLVIDMSHPYAVEVTRNASEACSETSTRYIRYVRRGISDYSGAIYTESLEECVKYLRSIEGTVLFTTGAKNIGNFEQVRGNNRFIYRILPAIESIKECEKHKIKLRDILAALGPYSEEFNVATFKEFGAEYVVMKDSGIKGGTLEKISACKKLKIKAIIIGREEEEGIYELDKLIQEILK